MPFDHILGQATAVEMLGRMLRSGQVHHALRFEGPEGVGKEMAAMALAQALLCESGDPLGCGTCSACTRAVTMGEGIPAVPLHPDVILVQRGLYPPEAIGRNSPETKEISVDQIRRVVLSRAPYSPHEGRAQVFIVREAEQLSVSAANALLKTLEEPGQSTYFVLLTSQPSRLLPTILSRTLRVRFSPLSDGIVAQLLNQQGFPAEIIDEVVPLAEGSMAEALQLADEETSAQRRAFVQQAWEAVRAPDSRPALQLAEKIGRDRHGTAANLRALAASAARMVREQPTGHNARLLARRYEVIMEAIDHIEARNALIGLTIEDMMLRLRALTG